MVVECREAAYTYLHPPQMRCRDHCQPELFWLFGGFDTGFRPTQPPKKSGKRDKMKNPFGDQQVPGSYHNLKERMYKKVSANVNGQIREIMVKAYENALDEENVVLSRPERKRLLSQIVKMVMEDVLGKLDGSSKPK
jgi:hypothetical protein